MSLKRIVLSLLVLWLGLMGIACGVLCLLCLIALLFWQGLGVGTAVLALLCLSCLGLAVMLSGRAAKRESKRLGGAGLPSLKTWWRTGSTSDVPRGLVAETSRGRYPERQPGSATAPSPVREAENWPEDLRPYGEWPAGSADTPSVLSDRADGAPRR